MTSRDFAYWLQGWFELNETIDHRKGATPETMEMIKNHLSLVFKHEIDPSMGDKEHQKVLNEIHKPTLEELGKEHNFEVTNYNTVKWGKKPGPDYEYSELYGWYHPDEGQPRC